MLVFISFFIFVLLVISLTYLFCNKRKKQNKESTNNSQKVHIEISLFKKLLYANFLYETHDEEKKDKSNTPT